MQTTMQMWTQPYQEYSRRNEYNVLCLMHSLWMQYTTQGFFLWWFLNPYDMHHPLTLCTRHSMVSVLLFIKRRKKVRIFKFQHKRWLNLKHNIKRLLVTLTHFNASLITYFKTIDIFYKNKSCFLNFILYILLIFGLEKFC